MTSRLCLFAALTLVTAHAVAAPRTDDYAMGITITADGARPLVEVMLPDTVYQNIVRNDLGDLRVFNDAGSVVPHAFCASPTSVEPIVTRESLPVFDLQAGTSQEPVGGTRVEVQTRDGTQIRVEENDEAAAPSGTTTWAHVIDARGIEDAIRAIEFDWTSPDGASQASVRIEASDDLDQWRTVVRSSTLVAVAREGQQLQRKTIPLLEQPYEYLRVVRTDNGPPLQIAQVIAERVSRPATIDPVWFTAHPLVSPTNAEKLPFDAVRLAPVTYARLLLPQPNSSVRVSIDSRPDDKAAWQSRWSGEVYQIMKDGERQASPPAEFAATHDRYWQVSYARSSDALNPAPTLELGYRPSRLRFLAQGGPYTLAFGSRRAELSPPQACDSLLSNLGQGEVAELVEQGYVGGVRGLGGETALKPRPKKTPVRLILLWGVLIVGVGLLIGMALTLLKRVR